MPTFVRFLALVFYVTLAIPSLASQVVGSIAVAYPYQFYPQPAEAQQWRSQLPAAATLQIRTLEVFQAKAIPGFGEIRIVRIEYATDINANLDGAAKQSLQNVLNLPGHSNVTHETWKVGVSGRDGRRVTFESSRFGGKLGAEFLFVLDRKTNAIYQLQLLFAKRKPLKSTTQIDLNEERNLAEIVIESVVFVK